MAGQREATSDPSGIFGLRGDDRLRDDEHRNHVQRWYRTEVERTEAKLPMEKAEEFVWMPLLYQAYLNAGTGTMTLALQRPESGASSVFGTSVCKYVPRNSHSQAGCGALPRDHLLFRQASRWGATSGYGARSALTGAI